MPYHRAAFFFALDMATEEEINDAIATNLVGPKRVRVDDQDVEQHDLADQVKAAAHLAGQDAVAGGRTGLRFFQLQPPGAGGTP